MEHELYICTATKKAWSSLTSAQTPRTPGRLQTHLRLRVYFFDSTADTPAAALLDEATTFRVGLKPADDPTAAALIYLATVSATGADYYDFEWAAIDSADLRTLLGTEKSVDVVAELSWTLGTTVERVAWPMLVENANLRTTDGPPDPVEDASDTFVRARAVVYDADQTLTGAQRWQALENLGITLVHGSLRIVLANGDIANVPLNSGEPTAP